MRNRLLALVGVLAVVMMVPNAAMAASCDFELDLETAIKRADSVFVAQVTSISDRGATAEARVLAVWKGPDIADVVTLAGGDPEAVDGTTRIHILGRSYLVVARWSRRAFVDDKCTATRFFIDDPNLIPPQLREAVGAEVARLPLISDSDSVSGGITGRTYAIAGLAGLLLALGVFLSRRAKNYNPRMTVEDYFPMKSSRRAVRQKRPRRSLAGWASGRFSKAGTDQVAQLKSAAQSNSDGNS
jgi:hypothetical protein